jgi:LuxR family transcriptional regulator, maltose regulon positive regulatory protein
LDACPDDQRATDPGLALAVTDVRLREGLPKEAALYIASAERLASLVPADRRPLFELQLASVRLGSAGRQGDLPGAQEAMVSLEAALEAQTACELRHSNDIRALALMTIGTTELWSLRLDDSRRHLEQALALAHRIGRPYLEIACLSDLAIAAPLSGLSAAEALRFAEQAVALAETHGFGADPVTALSFAIGGGSLAWLGRFAEAERWLQRAGEVVRPEESPATELALHHARGLLRSGQGRLEEALDAFRVASSIQAMLAGEHALAADLRMRIPLTYVRMGQLAAARDALESIPQQVRGRADALIPAAALALAEGDADRAVVLLAPVIDRSAGTLHARWAAVHALLFEAAAREQLGETRASDAALESALELAEPDGLILPFAITPLHGLLERHAAARTGHPTLLAEVLDVLGGLSPKPRGGPSQPADELSEAELRVVRYLPTNLKAPEIAAERFVSTNTVRTHLRHIYAKLGAHGRAEAVARARELRLLGPTSRAR